MEFELKPGTQELQQEIKRRRSLSIGYVLMTDEEIIKEIEAEKNIPVQKDPKDAKARKKKKRRRKFSPGYPFRSG